MSSTKADKNETLLMRCEFRYQLFLLKMIIIYMFKVASIKRRCYLKFILRPKTVKFHKWTKIGQTCPDIQSKIFQHFWALKCTKINHILYILTTFDWNLRSANLKCMKINHNVLIGILPFGAASWLGELFSFYHTDHCMVVHLNSYLTVLRAWLFSMS